MDERRNLPSRDAEGKGKTDHRQKRAAIEALVAERGAAAIPLLVEMLGNESWMLRQAAAEALASLGPQALDPLLPLARSGVWYSRAGAAHVLGAVGGAEAIHVLVSMLDDENRTVREAGIEAIRQVCKRGGAAAVSRVLFNFPPPDREKYLGVIQPRDAADAERIRGFLSDGQLMGTREDDEELWEKGDGSHARGSHGLVWEVFTEKTRDSES